MLDPDEGLADDGTILTGARRERVPQAFEPVVTQAVHALVAVGATGVLLYGSVATGRAVVGRSDVDLVAVGVRPDDAREVGAALSERFAAVCREVAVGVLDPDALRRDDDAAHGDRVFVRHYCVALHGPDPTRATPAFAGDRRAARGFNGDLGRAWLSWRASDEAPAVLGRRVARKTLLAVAGLVSVHDATWTTDRATAAHRWGQVEPAAAQDLSRLLSCAEEGTAASADGVRAVLADDGVVAGVVGRFAELVGLWDGEPPPAPA